MNASNLPEPRRPAVVFYFASEPTWALLVSPAFAIAVEDGGETESHRL